MGAVDMRRQAPNVDRMQRLGAEVVPVESGDKTLRAAIDEALREWVSDPAGIYYLLGSAVGAHPYPYLVRELQSVIGREARQQLLECAGGLSHPDHYFGAEVIKAAFPNARVVGTADTVALITKTWEGKVKQWGPMYGANLTSKPLVPEVTKDKAFTLDGEKIEIVGPVQGDDPKNTYVWIPSSKTLIGGDILYAGTHVWTAETKAADRKAWGKTLDTLAKLNPAVVIPGHQTPDAKQDASVIAFTKTYLADFDAALAGSKSSDEVQTKVKAKHGSLALDPILKFGADAQFPSPAAAKK
jgi:glyoxylase-like metal-dependent hydrolase (beta-lactamase superfamily II)